MDSWLTQFRLKVRRRFVCIAPLAVFAVFFVPLSAHAGILDILIDGPQAVLGMIVNSLLFGLAYIFSKMVALTLVPVLIAIASYNDFATEWGVQLGWQVVRDVANMFFIVVLLIIAIATIFKVESYSYRALLPKLVIMTVLINFSKSITGLMVDVSQVVMLTFVNSFINLTGGTIIQATGIGRIFSQASFVAQATGDVAVLSVMGAMLLAVAISVITAGVLLALTVVLAFRIIMLWILTVLSPLAFLLAVLPGGQKYASQWWEKLAGNLIVGPVLAFFLWLSFTIMQNNLFTQRPESSFEKFLDQEKVQNSEAFNPFGTEAGTLDSMINFIIVIGLLMGSLTVASQLGVLGGGVVGAVSGGLAKMGLEAAKMGGKFADKKMKHATSAGGFIGKSMNVALGKMGLLSRDKDTGKQKDLFTKGFGFSTPYRFIQGYKARKDEQYHDAFHGEDELGRDLADAGFLKVMYRGTAKTLDKVRQEREEKKLKEAQTELEEKRLQYQYIQSGGTDKDRYNMRQQMAESLKRINGVKTEVDRDKKRFESLVTKNDAGGLTLQERDEYDQLEETVGKEHYDATLSAKMDQEIKVLEKIAHGLYGDTQFKNTWKPGEAGALLDQFKQGTAKMVTNDDGSLRFTDKDDQVISMNEKTTSELRQEKLNELNKELEKVRLDEAQVSVDRIDASMVEVRKVGIKDDANKLEGLVNQQVLHKATDTQAAEYQSALGTVRTLSQRKASGVKLTADEENKLQAASVNLTTLQKNVLGDSGDVKRLEKMRSTHELLGEYKMALESGDATKINAVVAKVSALDAEGQKHFKLTAGLNERDAKKRIEDQLDAIKAKTRDLEIHMNVIKNPAAEEDIEKLGDSIKKLRDNIAHSRTEVESKARGYTFRGFYSKMAARHKDQEEVKKLATLDSGELVGVYRKAEHEHDEWKMRASLRQLAKGGNINDILNDYNYDSGFEGMKKFFSEKLHANAGNQEMMELVSDLSYMLEDVGHWDMSRVVKFDRKIGGLDWMSQNEHVRAALGEIKKRGSGAIANVNRLGYGGERPMLDGNVKFQISPLGKAIVNTFSTDFAGRIVRGELNPNVIQNLGSVLDQLAAEMPHLKELRDPRYRQTFYDLVYKRNKEILQAQTQSQSGQSSSIRPDQASMYL